MEALQRECGLASEGSTTTNDDLWQFIRFPFYSFTPISFEQHLISCGGMSNFREEESEICAYCHLTDSWIHVADLHQGIVSCWSLFFPVKR